MTQRTAEHPGLTSIVTIVGPMAILMKFAPRTSQGHDHYGCCHDKDQLQDLSKIYYLFILSVTKNSIGCFCVNLSVNVVLIIIPLHVFFSIKNAILCFKCIYCLIAVFTNYIGFQNSWNLTRYFLCWNSNFFFIQARPGLPNYFKNIYSLLFWWNAWFIV